MRDKEKILLKQRNSKLILKRPVIHVIYEVLRKGTALALNKGARPRVSKFVRICFGD
jgi:hypothetical protein